MITLYKRRADKWIISGYECPDCGNKFTTSKYLVAHESKCSRINTLKKEKELNKMPIQRITKGGETWYRWGQSGKLYRKREDAEKQAAAAYASGYKKKKKED